MVNREEALRKLFEMLEVDKSREEEGCTVEEVSEHLRNLFDPENMIYLTGDTHGEFKRICSYCKKHEVEQGSTFIILGDAGLNYFGDVRDLYGKKMLSKLPITVLCIHGNHEMRPTAELGYVETEFRGGKVMVEPKFPNILFALDGEVYDFMGYSCLVLGGAYSVDKAYRLATGRRWFPDEQPSEEIKQKVERVLEERGWKVDVVFSHTCPLRYEPTEVFLPMIDQSTVDKSTEQWLDEIEQRLSYERWYCGHYHTEKCVGKLRFMYKDYALLPHVLSIREEQNLIRRMEEQAEICEALDLFSCDDKRETETCD